MSARRVADRRSKKKKKLWTVDFRFNHPDGSRERVREVSPVQTRRGADEHERQIREALQAGKRWKDKEPIQTLSEFADSFLAWALAANKPSEHRKKETVLRVHLLPRFGHLRLDKVTVTHARDYAAEKIAAGAARKTVNNQLVILRRMLAEAFERGLISEVPNMRLLKIGDVEYDWLTIDECKRLLEHAGNWRTPMLFAMRTGLRIGELRALQWSDADFVSGKVHVRRSVWEKSWDEQVILTPKNHHFRSVMMTPEVVAAVRELPSRFRNGLLFPDKDGKMETTRTWQWGLEKAYRAAEMRRIGWHVLRHSFASHAIQAGVEPAELQRMLGHSDLKMTMRYAHLAPATLERTTGVLPALTDAVA